MSGTRIIPKKKTVSQSEPSAAEEESKMVRALTERVQQLESALQDADACLRAVMDAMPPCLFFKDRSSNFIAVNQAFAGILGKTPAALVGRNDFDFFPAELATKYQADDQRIMTSRQTEKIEEVNQVGEERRVVEVIKTPVTREDGEVIGLMGAFTDVTFRRRTEEALKRSQTFMNSVIENLPIMVFIKDAQLHFVLLNKAGEELTGYPREVFLGKSDRDFYPPELAEAYSARDREALAGGKLVDIPEEPLETRGKGQRILHTRKIPIRDEEGRPLYLLGISEDITERKEAEEKVRRFNSRLEQHNRELQDFVYVASHDLQEPLRKVQAFSDRLRSRCAEQLSPQGRDYLDRVQDAARRMQTLLEDLLTYSRVTTRANPFVTVDLNEIVRDVTAEMEEQMEKVQARVEAEPLPKIDADAMQMRQLVQQLLSNALKFRRPDEPPRVKIHSRIVTSPKAEGLERLPIQDFSLNARNPHCLLFVEDNGIGFEEKYVDRIFVVFQRLHGRGTYEGTGVGLAICRKIALRHNGEITATSQPGKGSTFILLLPIKQTKALPTAEPTWERTTKK